jgi:hypothetical protein
MESSVANNRVAAWWVAHPAAQRPDVRRGEIIGRIGIN